ncbi:DegT/DnrJ/EryC1/StrS family aminotransferase [Paenibacillus lautus]|uniref:DegT/DnrJ/EryC1/StrS family aminotransferase n=1 Tax=Paenibacillus lautus TaxID=1401 RepID=UPI003D2A9A08
MGKLAIDGGEPTVRLNNTKRWPFYSSNVEEPILSRIREGSLDAAAIDIAIQAFENDFSNTYCQGLYSIFHCSGTAALLTAYFALGLPRGAEVLVPTNTFRATVTPLLTLNLFPVFCDSDPITRCIDLDDAESRITPNTKALVVTHIWGHPADMERAVAICKKNNLFLVEDCSHAHGATWNGKRVGTFGDIAVFSLGTKKMISGGKAGILVTKHRTFYDRALLFSQPKHRANSDMSSSYLKEYLGTGLGVNFRGSPISAILANEHLVRLPRTIESKNNNLTKLEKAIVSEFSELTPPIRDSRFNEGTWYMYYCTWDVEELSRDFLYKAMKAEGMAVIKPETFLHNQKVFKDPSIFTTLDFPSFSDRLGEYPVSDWLLKVLIGFETREMYDLSDEVIDMYAEALQKISKNYDRLVDLSRKVGEI